jgi:hypothetical protein
MWTTLTESEPKIIRYSSSSTSWLGIHFFPDWFKNQMLPVLKQLEGKKI